MDWDWIWYPGLIPSSVLVSCVLAWWVGWEKACVCTSDCWGNCRGAWTACPWQNKQTNKQKTHKKDREKKLLFLLWVYVKTPELQQQGTTGWAILNVLIHSITFRIFILFWDSFDPYLDFITDFPMIAYFCLCFPSGSWLSKQWSAFNFWFTLPWSYLW